MSKEGTAVRAAVTALSPLDRGRTHELALAGQPFDSLLLRKSALFRRSRGLYLEHGGTFHPALVTTPRTLSSPILLENRIEYSPIAQELIWSASDPRQKKDPAHLLRLRTYTTSLFHEQNHRVLWKLLPGAPRDKDGLRRFLNFAEALVIMSDMALADTLGPELAHPLYLCGVIYDPGTTVRKELRSRRAYRNYLQACLHATYLNLEQFDPEGIAELVPALFSNQGALAKRAVTRSNRLDRAFVFNTNPFWQKEHGPTLRRKLIGKSKDVLLLGESPADNHQQYLWAERWMDELEL